MQKQTTEPEPKKKRRRPPSKPDKWEYIGKPFPLPPDEPILLPGAILYGTRRDSGCSRMYDNKGRHFKVRHEDVKVVWDDMTQCTRMLKVILSSLMAELNAHLSTPQTWQPCRPLRILREGSTLGHRKTRVGTKAPARKKTKKVGHSDKKKARKVKRVDERKTKEEDS